MAFTRFPNEVMDAMLGAGLSRPQLLVLLAVIRRTFGYQRTSDSIGLTQIAKMTGLHRTHAGAALRDLAEGGVVLKTQGDYRQVLAVNPNPATWKAKPSSEIVTNGVTLNGNRYDESGHQSMTEAATKTVTNGVTLKRKKEKRKDARVRESVSESFDIFWRAYPKKVARTAALKAFEKIQPDPPLLETILEAIGRAKASPDWRKDAGQYIPHAATWLNGERWNDEAASAAQQRPKLAL
jgi:phage replication O-like protein O